eukprot:g38493.t1
MAQAEEIRTETGPLDYDYTEKEVELCQEISRITKRAHRIRSRTRCSTALELHARASTLSADTTVVSTSTLMCCNFYLHDSCLNLDPAVTVVEFLSTRQLSQPRP